MSAQLGAAYAQYAPALRRFLFCRVGDPELAEDLVQIVFLEALRLLPAYEDRGYPISTWLYTIARSRASDARIWQRRHPTVPLDEWSASDDNLEATVIDQVDSAALLEAIADLTGDQRRVIELRFLGERSIAETAEQLGMTLGGVKALQHRALAGLRRRLTAAAD